MPPAIELRQVGKLYRKLDERATHMRSVLPFSQKRWTDLWALRGMDLEVEPGETVGVLGHNGAGKTTLLRLLAGVTAPTEGRVVVRGRIGPLISLGVGFHAEMTGRENAVVNGMLLGLSAAEIESGLDEIIEFAELQEFVDTPVKFYSSGMAMRLGFSVIMYTNPSVLLIDEIMAVGDAGFQMKCFDRLSALQAAGATIIVVSHSMNMLRQLCQRGLVMRSGRMEYDGDIEGAIALHCAAMSRLDSSAGPRTVVDVVARRLIGGKGENHHAHYDAAMELQLRLRFFQEVQNGSIVFTVVSAAGLLVASQTLPLDRGDRVFLEGEEVTITIPFRARLAGGNYELVTRIQDRNGQLLGEAEGLIMFVSGRAGSTGVLDLRAAVEVDGQDRTDLRESLLETWSRPPAT